MAGSYLTFEVDALRQKYAGADSPYNEFLRRRGMSVGLYVLPVGVCIGKLRSRFTMGQF